LEVVPVDPRPQVRIHLTTIGELLENSARLDLTDPEAVNRLERLVEATVAAEIAHAIESVQKRGTDVLASVSPSSRGTPEPGGNGGPGSGTGSSPPSPSR